MAKTALTITKTINNALLPLAAVNYAFGRAATYFNERFTQEVAEKIADIPPEYLIEPKASIAGPALQGLAFSHEEDELKEMYLSLLGAAMDERIAASAHPAFVEIIKQLTAKEARLLHILLGLEGDPMLAEVRLQKDGEVGWERVLCRHLAALTDGDTGKPAWDPMFPAMVDNWVRLGLVTVDYQTYRTGDDAYSWVEKSPEYSRLRREFEKDSSKVVYAPGVVTKTALGDQFARTVGILPKALPEITD